MSRSLAKYSTFPCGILIDIVPKVGIFPEAKGQGKYSLPRVQYVPIFHKEGLNIYWRVSEASETLSGVYKFELVRYMCVYIYVWRYV